MSRSSLVRMLLAGAALALLVAAGCNESNPFLPGAQAKVVPVQQAAPAAAAPAREAPDGSALVPAGNSSSAPQSKATADAGFSLPIGGDIPLPPTKTRQPYTAPPSDVLPVDQANNNPNPMPGSGFFGPQKITLPGTGIPPPGPTAVPGQRNPGPRVIAGPEGAVAPGQEPVGGGASLPPQNDPPIHLKVGVAVPQSLPIGTVMAISVDYLVRVPLHRSSRYVLVINSGAGEVFVEVQLGQKGNLSSFFEQLKPEHKPFTARIDEITPGSRQRVRASNEVPLKVDY